MFYRAVMSAILYVMWVIFLTKGANPKILFSKCNMIFVVAFIVLDLGSAAYWIAVPSCFDFSDPLMWKNHIQMGDHTTKCNMDKLFVFLSTLLNSQLTCYTLLYYSCKSGVAKLADESDIDSEEESIVDHEVDIDTSLKFGGQNKRNTTGFVGRLGPQIKDHSDRKTKKSYKMQFALPQ
jgi:hypothetical protein